MFKRIGKFFVTLFDVIAEARAMQAEFRLKYRNLSE